MNPALRDRRSLLRRHRGKIVGSLLGMTALATTSSILVYFIRRWIHDQHVKILEKQAIQRQISKRYEQTKEDSLFTVYELLPVFDMVLNKHGLDIDELFNVLKEKKNTNANNGEDKQKVQSEQQLQQQQLGDHEILASSIENSKTIRGSILQEKSKGELWNDLKLESLIKLMTISYTVSLLMLLTRLQLNILTRRDYLETAINVAIEKENGINNNKNGQEEGIFASLYGWIKNSLYTNTTENNESKNGGDNDLSQTVRDKSTYMNEQAYLSLSWWLINRGWSQLHLIIQNIVSLEIGDLTPRDSVSINDFATKLEGIHTKINNRLLFNSDEEDVENETNLINIMLPDETMRCYVLQQTLDEDCIAALENGHETLSKLVDETSKCIRSEATTIVLEALIRESWQYIIDEITFKVSKKGKRMNTADDDVAEDNTNNKYQMAVYSISVKDCCQEMLRTDAENRFLQRLHEVTALNDLSMSVYSNFELSL